MVELDVLAPVDGVVIDLEKVPDEVFAQKMVGDGVAIDPSGALVIAPIAGTLVKLFPGGHAFGIAGNDGIELIVHLGLDTIELEGEGFENIASEGQEVQVGTPIVRFDRATIERRGKVMLSPVVSTGNGTIVRRGSGVVRAGEDVLFTLRM
ncbi:MAG TPA: PTS glucose transporter subunit IIA [Ktedonobacteraceae bacterium]|nr:PTS glucose transporter subunit IIA [Ktedonobacteraceae bacterium]